MKKGFFLFSLMGLALLGVVSCSSDDDSNGDNNGGDVNSIMLNASSTSVEPGDSVDFTVMTDTDEDVTDMSMLEVDGDPIDGSSYTFDSEGTYTVMAIYEDFESNEVEITVEAESQETNDYVVNDSQSGIFYLGDFDLEGQMVSEYAFLNVGVDEDGNEITSQVSVITPEGEFPSVDNALGSIMIIFEANEQSVFNIETDDTPTEFNFTINTIDGSEEGGSVNYNYTADLVSGDSIELNFDGQFEYSDESNSGGEGRGTTSLKSMSDKF
ncbi:MAG: hypothetical protein ACQESK_06210 [Bacteroidota bacterium]